MPATEPQTVQEQNKRLVIRWFEEVWNQGRRQTIRELFAPQAVLHDGAQSIKGPEEFDRFYDRLHAEFQDFRVTPGVSVAEADRVALRWSVECRHTASGKTIHLTGMSIVRIENGCLVEAWQNWDQACIAAQLAS